MRILIVKNGKEVTATEDIAKARKELKDPNFSGLG